MSKINIRESLNRLDLQTDNKYDLLNTFDSKKLSDNSKKKLAEAIENNSIASINRVLHESEEKVFTVKVYQDYPFVAEVIDNSIVDKNGEGKVLKKFTNRDDLDAFANDLISKGYVNYQGYLKNKSLHESEEQLFKVVIQSGATKRDFESALYEDEAEEIVDYYGGRWIDENGFEWNMYVEEDDDSTEHAMVDDDYDIEDDDERAQIEMDAYAQLDEDVGPNEWEETDFLDNDGKKVYINNIKEAEDIDDLKDIVHDLYWHDKGLFAILRNFPKDKSFKWIQNRMIEVIKSTMNESLTEAIKDVNSLHSKIWNMDNNEKICFPNGYCVKCEFYDREGKAKRYIVTDKKDNVIIKGKFGFAWQPQIKKFEEDFFNLLNGRSVDEALTEANYGGAYDIDPEMFWTKEEVVDFAYEICEYLGDIFGYQYDINNVYMDGPRKLYINIYDNNYIEVESTFDIDMRKIRKPSDLSKVYGLTIENWFQKAFAREYRDAGLDESLTEDKKVGSNELSNRRGLPKDNWKLVKVTDGVVSYKGTIECDIYSRELDNNYSLYDYYQGEVIFDDYGINDPQLIQDVFPDVGTKVKLAIYRVPEDDPDHHWTGDYFVDYIDEINESLNEDTVKQNKRLEKKFNSRKDAEEFIGKLPKEAEARIDYFDHENEDGSVSEWYEVYYWENQLEEDTVKQNGKWVNKGSEGTHGKFKTKKAADAQRKAMFANGYKAESLNKQKYSSGNYFLTVDKTGMGPHYSLYYQHPHSDYDGLMFIVDGYGYDHFKEKLSKFSTIYPNKDVQNLLKSISDGRIHPFDESLNEARIVEPKYRDGDVVFVGDADGYHGTFLIKGDFRNIPEELYHNIRRITKYSNLDEPYYSVEYKIDSNHLFEEDYRKFFEYIIPILKDVGIDVLKSAKDIEYNESLKEDLSDLDLILNTPADTKQFNEETFRALKNLVSEYKKDLDSLDQWALESEKEPFVKKWYKLADKCKEIAKNGIKGITGYGRLNDFIKLKIVDLARSVDNTFPWYTRNNLAKFNKLESLKEAVDNEIDLDYETDFDDGEVEEGNTFIEDGRTWSWIERIAGPIHLDFDNWSVWSARDWDYIEEKVKPLLVNKEEFNVEVLTKIYDEAEVAYFVVDEDTGFIDWGPVETSIEAQDFLNGKVEDYENDEEHEEIEIEEESLTESKAIKNDGDYEVTLHYDDIGDGKEYDYILGYDEVVDYLKELAWANGDGPEDLNEDEYLEWVMDNFDELADKYELNVLNYFEDEASQYEYDHRYDEP
jgi:hypothetical protein